MKTLEQLSERLRTEKEVRIERMFAIIDDATAAFDHLKANDADHILYGTIAIVAVAKLITELDNIRLGEKVPSIIGNRALQ